MKRAGCLVLMLLLVSPGFGWAAEYRWSPVRYGGKEINNTFATGINEAEWIVGNWWGHQDPMQPGGAFRYSKGKFTAFDVPGVEGEYNIWAEEIGKDTTIVGTYFVDPPCDLDCGDGSLHAYLYRHGLQDHILIDVPGAFWTFPTALNDKRQVGLGYFAQPDPDTTTWGAAVYDYATNTFTPVTVLGWTEVVIEGLNNLGDMVGTVTTYTSGEPETWPWLRIDGQDFIAAPPGYSWGYYTGINDQRVVVGATPNSTGFTWNVATGAVQEIRHAKRNETTGWGGYVTAINDKGQLVFVTERLADGYTESDWLRPK